MNIEIKIDDKYEEEKIIIESSKITEELSNIINTLKNLDKEKIKVFFRRWNIFYWWKRYRNYLFKW